MKIFTKSTFALIAFVLFSQLVSAQTVGQGAWMVGGSAGFSSSKGKNDDKSTTTITIAPDLGYYIVDDLALLLGLNFTSVSFDGNSGSFTFAGIGARYYITDPIFVTAGFNFGLDEGAGTSLGGGVGYSWFLNNGLAIEPQLYFTSYNNDGDINDGTEFGLRIGIQGFLHHEHGME